MSGADPAPFGDAPRVLILGKDSNVLDAVVDEVAALGIAVQGSADGEGAARLFDGRDFDLVAIGRGLVGAPADRIRRHFAGQNSTLRFLPVYAPYAARQIKETLQGIGPAPVDLDLYCNRIGYDGPLVPSLETLRALHALHPATIPFEAIDVLLDRGVDLSPGAVDAKLIGRRRGGYCFEQNSLFKRVLTTIGFDVEGLIARVRWMGEPGTIANPRTHMGLRVMLDGKPWFADVGFGTVVPTAPLRMDVTDPQPTPHETFRLIPFGEGLLLQARLEGRWVPLYDVSPEPQLDVDYEMSNWYTATHPSSHFRHMLIAARTTGEARYALREGRLTVRKVGEAAVQHFLDADGIEQALSETFGLPVEPAWRPAIERAAAATLASGAG